MLEAFVYALTLALFSFVILATARMRHDMMLLGCIPPTFMAIVMGFIMALYSADQFGWVLVVLAVVLPGPIAWRLSRQYSPRDLLITIYLAWAAGLVSALAAFAFPDPV
jgi:hypothetical protein